MFSFRILIVKQIMLSVYIIEIITLQAFSTSDETPQNVWVLSEWVLRLKNLTNDC